MRVNWSTVQAVYAPYLATHWRACQAVGRDSPLEAVELSGVALRGVAIDRGYRYAVDAAR